jgi:catechol 2,3-dioxygenase-like lactoylglutathione lyase family enzyme/predicted small lipoprotein YifL
MFTAAPVPLRNGTWLFLLALLTALTGCGPTEQPPPTTAAPEDSMATAAPPETGLGSFNHITVGVADLEVALELWVNRFGFEMVAQEQGPDSGLAALWSLTPDDISRQALVRTPGEDYGMVHFVEFVDPDPPVRAGAEVFDLVPKNLDVSVVDLPSRFAEMRAAGQVFRTETYKEASTANGGRFREGQMKGHDDTNIVLLEVVGGGLPAEVYTAQGYAGVTALITIVPDAEAEKDFYQDALGLALRSESLLAGPEIEAMIGLPPGSGLDVSMLGGEDNLGHVEIIQYQGVTGTNRYPRARPKALGTLHINFTTADLAPVKSRLTAAGVPFDEFPRISTLFGQGEAIAVASPAGLRIEIHQRNP